MNYLLVLLLEVWFLETAVAFSTSSSNSSNALNSADYDFTLPEVNADYVPDTSIEAFFNTEDAKSNTRTDTAISDVKLTFATTLQENTTLPTLFRMPDNPSEEMQKLISHIFSRTNYSLSPENITTLSTDTPVIDNKTANETDLLDDIYHNLITFDAPLRAAASYLLNNDCRYNFNCSSRNNVLHLKEFEKIPESLVVSSCDCSSQCVRYGDCCPFSWTPKNVDLDDMLTCASINLNERTIDIYSRDRCPKNWKDKEIRNMCENGGAVKADPFLQIPATGRYTNVTYRNVQCAVCNGDLDIALWKTFVRCPNRTARADNLSSSDLKECSVFLDCPDMVENHPATFLKLCQKNIISDCPVVKESSNKLTQKIRLLCREYYSPVKLSSNGWVYKNQFCALCNNADLSNFTCIENTKNINPIQEDPTQPSTSLDLPSFAVLIDIDFLRGGKIVGTKLRCPPYQAYDPWKQMCRNLVCGKLYQNKEGQCVLNNLSYVFGHLNTSGLLKSNCTKMSLDSDEFTFYVNGTVVLKNGMVLQPGQYEIENASNILVCAVSNMIFITRFQQTDVYLTLIGTLISLISLTFKIGFYALTPFPKKIPTHLVFFLSVSLFCAQSLFLFISIPKTGSTECIVVGIAVHYFFLVAFFWTSALAFDIWKTFNSYISIRLSNKFKTLVAFNAYAWLIPLAVIGIAVILDYIDDSTDYSPRYGQDICWVSSKRSLLVFFAVPVGIILMVNVTFFSLTVAKIASTTSEVTSMGRINGRKEKIRLLLYIKLGLVMGLTWIIGFVAAFTNYHILWAVFVVFNSLQGAFILLAFTRIRVRSQCGSFRRRLSEVGKNARTLSSRTMFRGNTESST